MHPATRALLLGQADAEERKAEYKASEAEKLLAVAIELDNEAAACRATAKALRADAAGEKSVGKLTLTIDTSEITRTIEAAIAQARAVAPRFLRGCTAYDPRTR